jgi:hypothetical protein
LTFYFIYLINIWIFIGAAKTVQRKSRGGQDFGANYKIVPMSGKSKQKDNIIYFR